MKLNDFSIIPEEELCSKCNSAHQCEYNYFWLEPIIEDISEQNIFNLKTTVIPAVVAVVGKMRRKKK
jgi:hypothetical protein